MITVRRRSRIWLAAPAAVAAAALGLAVPAQAQVQPHLPWPAPSTPATTTQSLQSLVGHAPAGGKRWIVNDPVAYGQAVKSKKWVSTPSGLSYTGCVFHVPDHATVTNGLITLPSGAKHQLKPCEYPTLAVPGSATTPAPAASAPSPAQPATGGTAPVGQACVWPTGGVWWAASCYESPPDWATSMTQEYGVPTNPAKDGALIFIWGGMENASGNTLLQDVLTWGANGTIVTNPNIWYVTPWYLWSGNSVTGASIHVAVADTIVAGLTASNCNGSGACTWALTADDTTNGRSTSYTVTSGVSFQLIMGSVLEIPGNNACDELPTNGHAAFRHLVLVGNDGTITPDFGASTPDAHCSVSITQSPTSADILWKA